MSLYVPITATFLLLCSPKKMMILQFAQRNILNYISS